MSDRTVHAKCHNGAEVVRYDRAGKWYVEHVDGTRRLITLREAVEIALVAKVFPDRSGGLAFNAAVRRAAQAQR